MNGAVLSFLLFLAKIQSENKGDYTFIVSFCLVFSQDKKTDEGYIIKAGVCKLATATSYRSEQNSYGEIGYWATFQFDQPFPTTCYGVVITQSQNGVPAGGDKGSTWNTAVTGFNANTFTIFAGAVELGQPIYYIAFGK